MLGVLGILVSLALLMYLVYRGLPIVVLAPCLALLAALLNGGTPLIASYTQVFMAGLGNFIVRFFPLILVGSIFASLLEASGGARSIAGTFTGLLGEKNALASVVVSVAVLAYCGLTIFAIIFAAYPLAVALFRQADIPKRLIPAAIVLGIFFPSVALPGSVQVFNVLPTPYFKTTTFAAPFYGIVGGAIMFLGGLAWLMRRARQAQRAGEGFGDGQREESGHDSGSSGDDRSLPPFWLAFLPLLVITAANLVFSEVLIPTWETSYLAEPRYGATDVRTVRGLWAMLIAMVLGIVAYVALNRRYLPDLAGLLTKGVSGSVMPTMNVASEVGYGATIASLAGFAAVKGWILNLSPANPLISEAVAVNVLAGITGSASGGLSVAMQILGEKYYELALATGVSPELLHRVATMSSAGLDSLPQSGGVLAVLTICGLTHKQSYKDIAVVSLVVPLVATACVVILGSIFG